MSFFFLKNKSSSSISLSLKACKMFLFPFEYEADHSSLLAAPGPVDAPVVSGLHPRSATLTWAPPAPPNGVITNYTACLCLSSVCGNSTAQNSSFVPNSGLWSEDVGRDLSSDQDLRPGATSPGSGRVSVSTINMVSELNSSTIQHSTHSRVFSSRSPLGGGGGNRSNGSTLAKQSSTRVNPRPTSLSAISEAFFEMERSPTSGCFSAASDSSSKSRSATVSGNSTSFTFLELQPHQTYSCQVRTGKYCRHYHCCSCSLN